MLSLSRRFLFTLPEIYRTQLTHKRTFSENLIYLPRLINLLTDCPDVIKNVEFRLWLLTRLWSLRDVWFNHECLFRINEFDDETVTETIIYRQALQKNKSLRAEEDFSLTQTILTEVSSIIERLDDGTLFNEALRIRQQFVEVVVRSKQHIAQNMVVEGAFVRVDGKHARVIESNVVNSQVKVEFADLDTPSKYCSLKSLRGGNAQKFMREKFSFVKVGQCYKCDGRVGKVLRNVDKHGDVLIHWADDCHASSFVKAKSLDYATHENAFKWFIRDQNAAMNWIKPGAIAFIGGRCMVVIVA